MVSGRAFVKELAAARIGRTFNQYADGPRAPELRARLVEYLERRSAAPVLIVGEAAGYRGARVSGFRSRPSGTGRGPAEATATVMHHVLAELGLEERVLLWNVVPTIQGRARRIDGRCVVRSNPDVRSWMRSPQVARSSASGGSRIRRFVVPTFATLRTAELGSSDVGWLNCSLERVPRTA
jgi:hypothetical protein